MRVKRLGRAFGLGRKLAGVFVWAVNDGRVVEASLGYLIAPLVNVLLGYFAAVLALLALAGPLTALPLLLFAAGARRIPLTTLGLLQYIGPTIQFALGVWLFHEPFAGRLVGFLFIGWRW